jgi:aminopeptidase
MQDARLEKLAGVLLGHSLKLKPGDIVQVRAGISAMPLVESLYRRARELKIFLLVQWQSDSVSRLSYDLLSPDHIAGENFLKLTNQWELDKSKDIAAYLTIRSQENDQELSGVDPELLKMTARAAEAVSDRIINQRQWVLFYWPTAGQAQNAGMAAEKWFYHVLDVCLIDYDKLYQAEQALARRLEKADRVRITAPGTDLSFSIKGLPAVCCYGIRNLPDGEVYTAPVRDSVEGFITYNVPSNQWGHTFNNISLTFEKGRIIKSSSSDKTDLLEKILGSDEGAGYIGEFSFGVNPLLREPMGSTLFDEKICGSIHFTPGRAYAKADNGNRSALHWDLIQIQRPEYGGGEIYLDNELIRRDGLFLPDDLRLLNP